jgi:phage baseplate assembly protein W
MATTITDRYSDLDFTFTKHPITKDIVLSYDEQAIIRSMRNLLLTNHFEVPFNSQIGSNVRRLLFEPISPMMANILKEEIENTIRNYETRVILQSVDVVLVPDDSYYRVFVSFFMANSTAPISINFILERLR